MQKRNFAALVVATGILSCGWAQAQSGRPAPPSVSPPPLSECAPGTTPPANETTGSAPLSDRLAQSKGVICPPAGVDPGISVPPVGGGRMPVIPAPGTPGGDPGIQPK
jgi:hypothetical protein